MACQARAFPLLLVCFVAAPMAFAEEPPSPAPIIKTLVMPFAAKRTVDPGLASTMTDVALTTFSAAKNREVLGQNDITAALDLEADKQVLGCDDSGCLAEIASAMDVDSLITGSIDQVGENYLVILTELDARSVKQVARIQGTSSLDEGDLFRVVGEVASELLEKTSGKIQIFGKVEIQTMPSGLPVRIGTRDMGLSPISAELPVGPHRATIAGTAPGEKPAVFDIRIERKKITQTHVRWNVAQKVSSKEQEEYDSDLFTHSALIGTKALSGLPLCVIGTCCSSTYVFVAAQSAFVGPTPVGDESQSEATQQHYSLIFWNLFCGGACSAVGLLGAGILGWGVSDLFSFPEEPLPGVPEHHIKITAPDGVSKKHTLPARENEMAH
jgi:hypothetical protein